MKTLKYIMKTSAQKIFNVKFATFCAGRFNLVVDV